MQIGGLPTPYTGAPSAPQRHQGPALDAPLGPSAQGPSVTQTATAVVAAQQVEALIPHGRPRSANYHPQGPLSGRSQRAIAAYGAFAQEARRDSISRLLGIDLYA